MKRTAIGAGILAALSGAAAAVATTAGAGHYEEPDYSVVSSEAGYEVRRYEGWIAARVTVSSSYETSVREGFQVLAKYIFGGNRSRTAIDMTTPVATVPSETIDMTTPVSASGAGSKWTVSFMMPGKWTMATLPEPDDPRIDLVEVEPSLRVVGTFSGRATQLESEEQLNALLEHVSSAGLEVVGPPSIAQFNPPWTLGPWRRNEVSVPVRDALDPTATTRPPLSPA